MKKVLKFTRYKAYMYMTTNPSYVDASRERTRLGISRDLVSSCEIVKWRFVFTNAPSLFDKDFIYMILFT